jgi:tetratricopeptide (TPR) repeat protein
MKRNKWYDFVLSAVAAVLLCATSAALVWGQGGSAPAKAAAPTPSPAQQALSDAWKAFYDGHYDEAAKLASTLLKSDESAVRAQATHLYARAKWAAGTKPGRAEAQRAWDQAAKTPGMSDATRRVALAKVLLMDADAKRDTLKAAIAALEVLTKEKPAGTATAEVDIELCRLYVLAGRYDDAQTLLESVAAYLKALNKLELTVEEARPFLAAAQKALSQLKYERDAGRAPFEKAQKLQQAKQFKEAVEVYAGVAQAHPESDYAVRSQFCIGECLRDMGRPADALKQWNQFVKASPAGPWRGQALIGLIDLCLEQSFDLKAAKTQTITAFDQMHPGLAGEKSGPSWHDASYELYIRIGTIAALEGRYPGANLAFKEAASALSAPAITASKTVTTGKTGSDAGKATSIAAISPPKAVKIPEGLALLISMTDSSLPLTPADIGKPDSDNRAALTLALGRVYFLANSRDHAQSLFDRLLDPKAVAALTPAQKAYAQFGQGLLQEGKKPDDAKASYLASIKTCPSGSWNDEAICRVALLIQKEADTVYNRNVAAASADSSKDSLAMKSLTKADREKQKEFQASWVKARSEALAYWQDVATRYSTSPYAEPALYNASVLQSQMAETVSGDKSVAAWKDAAAALGKFCDTYPKSFLAGDAHIRQVDIALEQMFDLPLGKQLSAGGVEWAKQVAGATNDAPPVRALSLQELAPYVSEPRAVTTAIYRCYLRAGLAAYLTGDYDDAQQMFVAGGAAQPTEGVRGKFSLQSIGLFQFKNAARKKMPVWNEDALKAATTEQQKTAIMLADAYIYAEQPSKAVGIYGRFLAGDPALAPVSPALESYAIMQLALADSRHRATQNEALPLYKSLYDPKYAQFSWTPDGIIRLGVLLYNTTHDPKKAMPHYKYVFTKYPDHPEAERALYLYCLAAIQTGDKQLAKTSTEDFDRKYPNSGWRSHLADVARKAGIDVGA